jgi:hypothetical protein
MTATAVDPDRVGQSLTSAQIRALDPYQLMAELGKKAIHAGGGRSTKELLAMPYLGYDVVGGRPT